MIVTRHRKRRSDSGRLLFVLIAFAVISGVLIWPPSHRAVADGPLRPVWTIAGNAGGVVARPFTFAAQQQTIADRNREIRDLNDRIERQADAKADAEARAHRLEQQATAAASEPQATPIPLPRPAATAANGLAALPGTETASAEERRLAATWAAMEPEKAAAVVQRLPDDAATRVLGQMDADSAGAIMNALPAAVAARLSRAVAQVPPAAGR